MELKCVLLLALVAGATAGPLNVDSTKCSTSCSDNSRFNLQPGMTHEYTYEADMVTNIPGATEETSALHLNAKVKVEVLDRCEMALVLSDVNLEDYEPGSSTRRPVQRAFDFKQQLQAHALRFGYSEGVVSEICPSTEDDKWVLNIKRGILSSLQNSMNDYNSHTILREADVTGECLVEYEVITSSSNTHKVRKTKDLNTCMGRDHFHTFFQATNYRVPSRLQSLPIMKGEHKCEQEIMENGMIMSTTCEESHLFRPFSNGNSGAMTTVKTTLAHTGHQSGVRTNQGRIDERRSMVFEHDEQKESSTSHQDASNTLRKICQDTQADIKPTTPGLFKQLVQDLQKLDTATLSRLDKIVSQTTMCDNAVKFFYDAIPTLGTTASVALIKDMLMSGKLSQRKADMWLTSLAFVPRPSKEMLATAKMLLDSAVSHRKAALSISSLVNSYCRLDADCGETQEVQAIIRVLEERLRYNCRANNDVEHEMVMVALKSLGNTGHAENVAPTLNRCIQMQENPIVIRVTATQAFRRMACTADTDVLVDTLKNADIDSELRINAYLALMACPKPELISTIKDILETEKVNQVGSFMWTHLTNLRESSDPFKREVRTILENTELKKEFDLDKRKFSRNLEFSRFFEMANAGAVVDSNLIWSPESFIPRSASVNLTIDLFGQSVNLMEVGGRVEGVDGIMEKVFGPGGEMNDVLDRKKRDVSNDDINRIDSSFRKEDNDPRASYYIRIFGNEIRYGDLKGFDMETVKEKFNYLEFLIDLAKEHEFEATKSMVLLDSTLVVPTGVGMPLRLSVDGTAVTDIKVKGRMDMRQAFTSPHSMDIDGSISPSAAIEINGEMGIDAFMAKTGLKMVNTFHTSTVAQAKIQLQEGQIFNLDISMPQEKMEIFNAESKFFIHHRGDDKEQKMIDSNRIEKSKCAGNKLVKALGVDVCGSISVPQGFRESDAPWFPLTGPASVSLTLEKKDTFTSYHFETKVISDKNTNIDIARISFNTPGSRVNREFTMDYSLNKAEKTLALTLISPWKRAELTGAMSNTAELKRIATALTIDGVKHGMEAAVRIQKNPMNTEYMPSAELIFNDRPLGRLNGKILRRPGKKTEVELSLTEVFDTPLTLNGEIKSKGNKRKARYEVDLAMSSHFLTGSIGGFFDGGNVITTRTDIKYAYRNQPEQRITLNNKWHDQSGGRRKQYSLESSLTTSAWSDHDSDMSWEFLLDPKTSFSTSLEAGYTKKKQQRITFTASADNKSAGPKYEYQMASAFKFPSANKDYSLEMKHEHDKMELKSEVTATCKGRVASADVHIKREKSQLANAFAVANLKYPGNAFKLEERLEERNPQDYYHVLTVTRNTEQLMRLLTEYRASPRHELKAELNLPNIHPIKIDGYLNPNIRQFQVQGGLEFNRQRYNTEGEWSHRQSRKNFNSKGKLEVSYPARKIAIDAEATKQNDVISSVVNTQWDVDRDPSQKVTVSGEVVLSEAAPKFQIKSQWFQRNYFDLSGELKNDKRSLWHAERDLEGSVTFKSSFNQYENINAAFKHERNEERVASHGELSWADNKKFEADFTLNKIRGWSALNTVLAFSVPSRVVRQIRYEMNYDLQEKRLTSAHKVQWDNKQMTMDLTGMVDLSRYNNVIETELKIATPFQEFSDLALNLKHNNGRSNIATEAKATWNRQNTAGIDFKSTTANENGMFNNNGEVVITIPTEETPVKITWTHEHGQQSFKTNVDGLVRRQDYKYQFEGKYETGRKREVLLTAKAVTPLHDPWSLEFNHQHDRRTPWNKMLTRAAIDWGQSILLVHSLDVDFPDFSTEFKFNSPLIQGMETIELTLVNTMNRNRYNLKNQFKYGENLIALDGHVDLPRGGNSGGELRFLSPFEPVQRLILRSNTKHENGVYETEIDFEYAPRRKFEIKNKLGLGATKEFVLDVRTPFVEMQTMTFSVVHNGQNKRNFITKATLEHNQLDSKIEAELKVDSDNINDIKNTFTLETPFRVVRFVRAAVNHRKQGTTYKSDASLEYPGRKLSINNDLDYKSYKDFGSRAELVYAEGKTINLDISFKHADKLAGTINLKTPFRKARDVTFSVGYDKNRNVYKTNAEFKHNTIGNFIWEGEFKNTRKGGQLEVLLKTPFNGYKAMAANINHKGNWKSFKNSFKLRLERSNIEGTGDFQYRNDNMRAKFTLDTPWRQFKNVVLEGTYQGPITNHKIDATLKYSGKTITFKKHLDMQSKTPLVFNDVLEVTTPYNWLQKYKSEVTHTSRGPLDYTQTARVEYNNKVYTHNQEFKYADSNLDFKADNVAMTDGRRTYSWSTQLEHRGPWNNFRNSATFKLNDNTYSTNSEFMLDRRAIQLTLRYGIQLPNDREYSINIRHSGGLNQFTQTFEANLNGRQYHASGSSKITGRNAEINGQIRAYGFESPLSLRINHQDLSRAYRTNVALATPFQGYESINLNFNHDSNRQGFESSLDFESTIRGFDKMRAELKWEGDVTSFTSTFKLTTPHPKMRSMTVTINHQQPTPNEFVTSITIDYPRGQINGELKYKGIRDNYNFDYMVGAKLSTPYRYVRNTDFTLEAKNDATTYVGKAEANYNGEKWVDVDISVGAGDVKTININAREPYRLATTMNLASGDSEVSGDANIHMDDKKPVSLNFVYRTLTGGRELTGEIVLPKRTLGMTTKFEKSENKFAHKMEVKWDNKRRTKMMYEIEGSHTMRRDQRMLDGALKFASPLAELEITASHRCQPGVQHKTTVKIQDLVLTNDITIRQMGPTIQDFQMVTKAAHGTFLRDVVLTTEGVMQKEPFKYDGKMTLEYANEKIDFTGKIADFSTSRTIEYIAEATLLHPSTGMDFDFKSQIVNNDEHMGGKMDMLYKLHGQERKTVSSLRAMLDKDTESANLNLVHPLANVNLDVQKLLVPNGRGLSIQGDFNDLPVRAEFQVTRDPSVSIKIYYDNAEEYFQAMGKYLSRSEFELRAHHTKDAQQILDALLSVRMNNTQLMHIRAHLRPDIKEDLRAIADQDFGVVDRMARARRELAIEVRQKGRLLHKAMEPMYSTINDVHKHTSATVRAISNSFKRTYNKAYNQNKYYVRDIHDYISEMHYKMSRTASHYWAQAEPYLNNAADAVQTHMERSHRRMINGGKALIAKTYNVAGNARVNSVKLMNAARDKVNYAMHMAKTELRGKIMDGVDRLRQHPRVRPVLEALASWTPEDYVRPLRQWHTSMRQGTGKMADAYNQVCDLIEKYWQIIQTKPELRVVKQAINEFVQKVKQTYAKYDINERFFGNLRDLVQNGPARLDKQIRAYIRDVIKPEKTRFTVWAPEEGEIQAEIYFPYQIRNLHTMPAIRLRQFIGHAAQTVRSYVPETDWDVWDTFYKYKPSGTLRDWIPPFKAHATLSGSQHFMTFDKKFYEFSGQCSYLLTRDFINGLFSVVVNYDQTRGQPTKKSIEILSSERRIEIFPNYKVTVNGKRTELPVVFGETTIRRIRNDIRVDNDKGITITCDLPYDRCTVNVTGWYYGKTGGLFGTYDNEPYTDLLKSDRSMATNTDDFAQSWALESGCRTSNAAINVDMDETSRRYKLCAKYFVNDASPFRLCFKQIDNDPFMRMCMNEMPAISDRLPTEEDVCKTGAFYVDECKRIGIPIRLPKACVSCNLPDGRKLLEGDDVKLNGDSIPQAADVVLVVSHDDCNSEIKDRLTDMVGLTDKAFKTKGIRGVRYAIVGYGGVNHLATPHSQTIEGELFNSKHKFNDGVSSFELVEAETEDPMEAVMYAARYPFRPGVSKSIILVPCGSCREQRVKYATLQQLLRQRDITLHLFLQHDFKLRAESPKTSYIFGIDRNSLYTHKDVDDSELRGDKELRKQALTPKDLCAALAHETDGSVFNSRKLMDGRQVTQKKFLDVFTRLVAKKAEPNECQNCECTADEAGQGVSVCRPCVDDNPYYNYFPDMFTGEEDLSSESSEEEPMKPKKKPAKRRRAKNARRARNRAV